jgi:HPt (histidine-containing phosphotransfer) domain-containing protein
MDDGFKSIVLRFRGRCVADLAQLRKASAEPAGLADPAVHTMIHRLSGMAGSVGFRDLGRLAGKVDDALVEGRVPDPDLLRRLDAALADVSSPA